MGEAAKLGIPPESIKLLRSVVITLTKVVPMPFVSQSLKNSFIATSEQFTVEVWVSHRISRNTMVQVRARPECASIIDSVAGALEAGEWVFKHSKVQDMKNEHLTNFEVMGKHGYAKDLYR